MMDLKAKCVAEFEYITGIGYDDSIPIHVSVVDDMTAHKASQQGNEGLNSISLNGISESYQTGYNANIMRILMSLKKRVKIL